MFVNGGHFFLKLNLLMCIWYKYKYWLLEVYFHNFPSTTNIYELSYRKNSMGLWTSILKINIGFWRPPFTPFISPLMLWVRISIRVRCTTLCDKSLSMTCDNSVVFSRYSGFLHQKNWPPRYNWNIVESGIKHHKTNLSHLSLDLIDLANNQKLLCFCQNS